MRRVACLHPAGGYLPVVVVVDDVVLPVPAPDGGMVVVEELDGPLIDELEPDGLVLLVVSVVVVEDDAGGSGGVVVDVVVVLVLGVELGGVRTVVLLLGVELGGVTTVVRSSLRSQPATPTAMATAKALDSRILDFMGNFLSTYWQWVRKTDGNGRPPDASLASSMPRRPRIAAAKAHVNCGRLSRMSRDTRSHSRADCLKKLLRLCNGCAESGPGGKKSQPIQHSTLGFGAGTKCAHYAEARTRPAMQGAQSVNLPAAWR